MKKIVLIIAAMAIWGYSFSQVKVLSNGNMGIGITNPTQKLHVVGNTYMDGNLGVGIASPAYKLDVGGNGRFLLDPRISSELIFSLYNLLPPPLSIAKPAIYGGYDNGFYIGRDDRWAAYIWSYNIKYQTITQVSDVRLKENIKPVSSLLSKLKDVQAYNYNFTDEYFKSFTPEEKQRAQRTEFGFLAQELRKIFPELVHEDDSTGLLSINYVSMVPILTSAINELQQKIESLEKALSACCNTSQMRSMEIEGENNTQQFELTNPINGFADEMKVYQNAPNPFNTTTTIQCYISETVQKAELCVYNMHGVQIKCLAVSERGTVNVQIQAGQLSAGVYTYLLIGDAKTSDAKQMILTK